MVWIKWVLIKASTPSKNTHEGFLAGFQHRSNDAGSKERYRKLYHLHRITFPPISKLNKVNQFVNDFLKNILKKIKALMNFAAQWKRIRYSPDGSEIQPTLQLDMQTIYDNHILYIWLYVYIYVYTYPLYNESIVIISQSLCIPHVQPCPRCFQQLLWLGWWRCIEVDGILWSHTWNPEATNPRGIFGRILAYEILEVKYGGDRWASTKLKPWCLDHLLTLGGPKGLMFVFVYWRTICMHC